MKTLSGDLCQVFKTFIKDTKLSFKNYDIVLGQILFHASSPNVKQLQHRPLPFKTFRYTCLSYSRGTVLQALWNITIIGLLVLGFSSNASGKVTVGFTFNFCVSWSTTFNFYDQTLKTKLNFNVNLVNNESKEKPLIPRRENWLYFRYILYSNALVRQQNPLGLWSDLNMCP